MGICYLHGRYEDTTAPGCPKCAMGEPVYMSGLIRHPDAEPDAPEPPCPSCSSLRARAEEAEKKLESFCSSLEGYLDRIEPKVARLLAVLRSKGWRDGT